MMSADTLARIRFVVLGLAGLTCAAYSALAVLWDTPQPFSPWAPGVAGSLAAVVIWISAVAAGARNAGIAMDELYQAEWARAVQFAYWAGIALFILAAILIGRGVVGQSTGFAAFGTAYGAMPLLAFCALNARG